MNIIIDRLRKEYKDVVAVDDISLEIKSGELFSLLGLNGAGKTTLIKMLSTLTKPTSGFAFIDGYSILNDEEKIKEIIDISMQETAIARKLTVDENLDFYGLLNGMSKDELLIEKEYLYNILNLENVKNKIASKLSGGYQRKLSIALALIKKPKILFLDEPTLGLDVISRRELWNAIKLLKGKMTIILTTHYMEEAEELSDRIGIIKEGKMLFVGDKSTLFSITNELTVENAFVNIVTGGIRND